MIWQLMTDHKRWLESHFDHMSVGDPEYEYHVAAWNACRWYGIEF